MEHRRVALEKTLEDLDKRFGHGTVMRLGQQPVPEVETISTGSPLLDTALGTGGYPRGRVVEVYGPESSGKTTLTLHAIAEAQRAGGTAAFVDAEHALDVSYASALGVKVDELLVAQPDHGEQALEIVEALVRSGAVDLVVVDSVAALTPKAELEGDMGDAHMGLQARLMSQALRKITAITSRTRSTVIFINQIRQKIGVVFGNSETTTGGNALKFYSSVRIDIRRGATIKASVNGVDTPVGNKVRVKVVKNKLAPPFRQVDLEIRYGRGLCPVSELIITAEKLGVLTRKGSWFQLGEESLCQGRDAVRKKLLTDEKLVARFQALIAQPKEAPEVAEAK
jgi:recombination protein RecA